MSKIRRFIFVCICGSLSSYFLIPHSTLQADEPAAEFLEALREKEYYDIAIKYLTSLETSDLISEEFRRNLPFEKAETLIKSASRIRDTKLLEARLDEAERLLSEFSGAVSSPESAARTSRYRGNLRLGRSRLYNRRAESDRLTAQEKADLVNKSREMLDLALADYEQAREFLKTAIGEFKVDVSDPGTSAQLKKLRSTYTQIRLRLPIVKEQLADTYAAGSPQQKKLLEEAAKEYVYLYDTYRRFAAGLDSGLYSARCYYKIGNIDEALNRLQEIFALENTGAFKTIKRKALVLAADCWSAKEDYPADSVIKQCEPLVSMLTKNEIRNPDWLKIQLELAKAYRFKSVQLDKDNVPGTAAQMREYKREAAKLIKVVSRAPGETREQAAKLMAEWNLDTNVAEAAEKPPESFIEARQKGEDLVTEVQVLLAEQAKLKSQLRRANSDDEKPKLQAELNSLNAQISELIESALGYFDIALSFRDDNSKIADINKLRYLQCFCYFVTDRFFESALIGEFLLNRYPTVDWTRQAAALVVRSYTALHNAAPKEDRQFEKKKLTEICQQMVDRWPGSTESSAAASTMTSLALEQKDFDAVEKYFDDVADRSPSKSALGLRIGHQFWFAYAKTDPSNTAERESLLTRCKKYLSSALAITDAGELSYDAALGSLLLVNVHLRMGETDEALARLETEAIAPLDLIKQKHPVVTRASKADNFRRSVYNTAIDVYLAAMKNGGEQQQWIDKVSGVISAIKNDASSQSSLTNTYRKIANTLKSQFDNLETADQKRKFSKSLASFLGSIEKDSQDADTVLWSGTTLLSVANSLTEQKLDADAKPLFQQAVSALGRAESIGFTGTDSDKRVLELRRQKALAERGSGNYEKAVNQLAEILKANPNNLSVQLDAAETLHKWAMQTKRASRFAEASSGAIKFQNQRTKKQDKAIWGWRRIVDNTRGNPKFKEQYDKALYYQIEAFYQYGSLKPDPQAVNAARRELSKLAKRDPTMSGPKWKAKYDELRKQIN